MAKRPPGQAIMSALETANIDYPNVGDGTTRDQHIMGREISSHLTQAVLLALKKEGYVIAAEEES
jgi:hypothetical protein